MNDKQFPSKRRKFQSIRNRSTQVNPEEIDSWNIQKSHEDSVPGENKPIVLIDNESIEPPQCRFCLRRVSFENLKVISNDHKSKAMVALQLKVFPRDVYPYGCINCLNLLDIFVDFKSSVTKAKRLLLTKRMHLESESWDDATVTEAFQQCKCAVEQHRIQIDAVYEKCVESTQSESRHAVDPNDSNNKQTEDNLENTENAFGILQIIEIELDQIENLPNDEIIKAPNMELVFEKTIESLSDTVCETTNVLNTELCFEKTIESQPEIIFEEMKESTSELVFEKANALNPDVVPEEINESSSILIQSEEINQSSKDKTGNNLPCPSKRRSRQSQKLKTTTSTKLYQDHELPAGIRVLCDICGESMYSQSLESHKNRHIGVKPYTCPVGGCGFMFYSRANMATHMRRMHAERGREEHKCDICGKFVRGQPGCLNVHKKRHTNERKYVCHLCGKGFTMTAYLRQHMLSHSVEFPHQCRYCGKKFNNKYSMKNHEKSVHEKKNHVLPS